jgi:hypothetical protein
MTEQQNDPLGIGHWPKWKQFAFFVLALVIAMVAFDQLKIILRGSPEARAYKYKIEPLAEQLIQAQKMGDKPTALALAEPTVKIINDYNDLDDAQKSEINKSPMRYCILAAVHLSSGPIEVLQTGDWASRSKYEAALNACK